jgi:hypothetical protein
VHFIHIVPCYGGGRYYLIKKRGAFKQVACLLVKKIKKLRFFWHEHIIIFLLFFMRFAIKKEQIDYLLFLFAKAWLSKLPLTAVFILLRNLLVPSCILLNPFPLL